MRGVAEVSASGRVRLWSRLGNEKTTQFPEIAAALQAWARRLSEPVVLDGEIVALDSAGEPAGFQNLQGRIHVAHAARAAGGDRIAYMVFDVLRIGRRRRRDPPLIRGRAELEPLFRGSRPPPLR